MPCRPLERMIWQSVPELYIQIPAAPSMLELAHLRSIATPPAHTTPPSATTRVSVAVLVDGSYAKNDKGELVYQPRAKEEIDRIAALVRSAIGFDQKRGDQVEIINLRFAEPPAVLPTPEPAGFMGMLHFTKDDVMYVVELGVMLVLGIVVLLLVVRPLVKRVLSPEMQAAAAGAGAGTGGALIAGGEAGVAAGATPPGQLTAAQSATAQLIDVAQVQGQVHAQSVHRVGELAEKNPNETVSIIRQWLSEPA